MAGFVEGLAAIENFVDFHGLSLKKNINILFLAIAYKGVAIPIYWIPLNKKGSSNTRKRIALIKRFVAKFGQQHIKALLSDREFIGEDWLKFLKKQKIIFIIRIKKMPKF